jgi:hypothetical protein
MNRVTCLICSHFLLLAVAGNANATLPLFADDAVLEIELTGPVGKTTRDKRDSDERGFVIAARGGEWPVQVRVRGKSRRTFCKFPPLRLNFLGSGITDGPFAGLGKVKLVTHCAQGAAYSDNLLEEYAAYRMLHLLTERSHRVRLLRIRYVDTEKARREPLEKFAFALEPLDSVAERMGAEVGAVGHVVTSRIDREQAAIAFVFQYLIANVDWSLVTADGETECCHNMQILLANDKQVVVPYDFDLSGFVYPGYARRAKNMRTRTSRKRNYIGYCLGGLQLDNAIAAVVAVEDEIMALIEGLAWSDEKYVQDRREFLREFFAQAAAGGLAERMTESCVGK